MHATPADIHAAFYIDQILGNGTALDAVEACCILEAVFARLKCEMPRVSNIWILSDNAFCYQKNLFPVFAPIVGRIFDINVRGLLHSET